jgi:hypothetical protein
MLLGLRCLHCHGGGTFRLGRVLWKQVRFYRGVVLILSSFTDVPSIPKGVIWLLVAAIAEIPPVVSPAHFLLPSFNSPLLASQVFICLNLNGNFYLAPAYRGSIDQADPSMEISVVFNLVCSRSLHVYLVRLDLTPHRCFKLLR